MLWYNSKTNELQSNPPWRTGYLHPDIIAQNYSDWQQVSDDFKPSVPEPTKEQRLNAINIEYPNKINDILQAISIAQALGNPTTTAQAKLTATYAEWKTKVTEIMGGA